MVSDRGYIGIRVVIEMLSGLAVVDNINPRRSLASRGGALLAADLGWIGPLG